MKKQTLNLFRDFLSLLYPDICLLCGNMLSKGEKIICTPCIYQLPRTNFHLIASNPLCEIFLGRVDIKHVVSFLIFQKGSGVQHLMHQFKYKNRKEIGLVMGEIFAYELKQTAWIQTVSCIIPIPLHPKKMKTRGYNQSEEFAAGLANVLGIPLQTEILKRVKFSETQTRKTKYKRWENVKGIFQVENPHLLQDQHILLVDDVLTTGATIEAASISLQQASNIKISVATLAYAAR